jgi:nitroreductase
MSENRIDFILDRQSCRNYMPDALKEGDLEQLMEALRWAPSAGNCQPWHFYVVTRQAKKDELALAAYGQSFIADAPVVFVICADADESAGVYGRRGKNLYCLQDTAAAAENLLLAVTALDYGSCWIGAFDEAEAASALRIPKSLRPVAIVHVGHVRSMEARTDRKATKEIFDLVD